MSTNPPSPNTEPVLAPLNAEPPIDNVQLLHDFVKIKAGKAITLTAGHTSSTDDITLRLGQTITIGVNEDDLETSTSSIVTSTSTGTSTNLVGTTGQVLTYDTGNALTTVDAGTEGQVLTSNGDAAEPTFENPVVHQQVRGTSTTEVSTTAVIASDDSIPQNTEGAEVMTLAITPKSSTSTLVIEYTSFVDSDSANTCTMALFQDSTADALSAIGFSSSGGNRPMPTILRYTMTSGTTSSTTFKIRIGSNGGINTHDLRILSTALYGGVNIRTFTITEYDS